MKIVADRDRCVGAGQCARIAPELFDQGQDDGLVVVLNAEPDESLLAEADEAVDLCPAGALSADA
ncbi:MULTISPECIES: ferredoxin [Streptomyces]|uniref:Ferredoxin n=1 Tax=Streptomyces parvulus TaxID=146923 RepID=A0A191VAG2_9ACTN|nr:ferredoxin [Streptomyces parvulus]ANJ11863.1 ferredoxin [Streptomyces parvulus]MCQ4193394.1 ferredoxin [Streptomyces parvulus]MZD56851.1 ferredoxin [Streptomyces sp. SID5606]GGR98737.1 ferredoxin [Streptomyces parvulus]